MTLQGNSPAKLQLSRRSYLFTWLTQRISRFLSLTLLLHRFPWSSSNTRKLRSFRTLKFNKMKRKLSVQKFLTAMSVNCNCMHKILTCTRCPSLCHLGRYQQARTALVQLNWLFLHQLKCKMRLICNSRGRGNAWSLVESRPNTFSPFAQKTLTHLFNKFCAYFVQTLSKCSKSTSGNEPMPLVNSDV